MTLDSSHSGKPVGHIPLLWLALPVLIGTVATELVFVPDNSLSRLLLFGGLLGCLLALVASIWEGKRGSLIWKLSFPLSAFFLSLSYGSWRSGPVNAPAPDIAAREVVIQVRIEQRPRLLQSGNAVTTTVTVLETPPHLSYLRNEYLPLLIWLGDAGEIPDEKSTVLLRAELRTVASMEAIPYREYLLREGYRFRLGRGHILEVLQTAPFPYYLLQSTCNRFENILRHGADNETKKTYAGVAAGMMLGNRASLTPEQQVLFTRSGTMHLFAISGLHVGILALVLGTLFSVCRVPRRWIPLFALPLLGAYVAITGASPSAIRAWIMISLFWLGHTGRRQAQAQGTLACSLTFILIIDPSQIRNIGFQLSYFVVFAIVFYGLPLARYWQNRWQPFRHLPEDDWTFPQRMLTRTLYWTASGLAISVSATLASLPLTLVYFQLSSPIGILLNTLFSPIALLVISSGSLSLLFGMGGLSWISSLFNHACWLILILMEKWIALALHLPFAWQQLDFRHPLIFAFCGAGLSILMAWVGCQRKPSAWHLAAPPLFLIVVLVIGTQSVT